MSKTALTFYKLGDLVKNVLIAKVIINLAEHKKCAKIIFSPSLECGREGESEKKLIAKSAGDLRGWELPLKDLKSIFMTIREKFDTASKNKLPQIWGGASEEQILGSVDMALRVEAKSKVSPANTKAPTATASGAGTPAGKNGKPKSPKGTLDSDQEDGNMESEDLEVVDPTKLPPSVPVKDIMLEKVQTYAAALSVVEKKSHDPWPKTDTLSNSRLQKALNYFDNRKGDKMNVDLNVLLPEHLNDAVRRTLKLLGEQNPESWRVTYKDRQEDLLKKLLKEFPVGIKKGFEEKINAVPFKPTNLENPQYAHDFAQRLSNVVQEEGRNSIYDIDTAESEPMLEHFKDQTLGDDSNLAIRSLKEKIFGSNTIGKITLTLGDLCDRLIEVAISIAMICSEARKFGYVLETDLRQSKKRKFEGSTAKGVQPKGTSNPCNNCGGNDCPLNQCKIWKTP